MSRPREFDEEAVLERALELFWRDGYAATSLQALLTHMGISRQSLYNTFGDKRRLFLAALDRYADLRAREMLGDLEHEDASLAEVFGFFERLGQNAAQKGSCGAAETHPEACLIGRSCMELGAADPEVAARVHYFFDRTVKAFRNALDNAVRKGEIETLDTAATAVKPGGRLVYAVCTLTRDETDAVAATFTRDHPEFEPAGFADPFRADRPAAPQATWEPQVTGGNGMFVAAWRRVSR